MMYKLIACDLDETLISDDSTICERNREAIKKALSLGVKFVPATGRGYVAIANILRELNLYNKADEYVISFNGGCISENKDNQILKFTGIPFKKAEELFNIGKNFDVCIHVYTKEKVYLYHASDDEFDYMKVRHPVEKIDDQTDLSFLKGEKIAKMIYGNQNMNYLHEVADKIKNETADLDVSYSSNRFLELNHAGINKGTGLIWLADKLGIKPEETMALGDNWNDLSMIQAAGLGIGMQNAVPDMKKDCDFITAANNNQGGVGEAIERFILKSAKD
ncbi:hypothetical protein C5L18_000988 [Lactobacillus amylolyticus]|uniref:Cof-like hydrolase n=2 Tax=Lactobacillus amylolyticus TaxID=83683 RepID=D4YRZ9_9LACO|nr:Cof-like hydrolase [Lactobacillus amylolyticus DSM 11664]KRL19211.1 IIB family HAD hydrolase [Lactobacillus amylolyticus DSM 11664]TDG61013.1 hypothetical protein C5L18_000988 [Lactobacillus amylolyticus]